MPETNELKAQIVELQCQSDKLKRDYEFAVEGAKKQELKCTKARNEIVDLKKQIRFLSGEIEAFKYCVSHFCGRE